MRKVILSVALAALIWCLPTHEVSADVSLGVSLDQDGLKGFYLAIGEHYKVPETEVVVVRQKNVPDEELPVVFFLARQASVSPETII